MRPLVFSDTITIRTDRDLREAINSAAKRDGASASEFLRSTLRTAVTAPPVVSRPYGVHAHVPAASIASAWSDVLPFLAAACARPGCDETPDTLRTLLEREQGRLLLLLDEAGKPAAAGVFQLRDYESGRRACWILALAGRPIIPWRQWIDSIEPRARAAGAVTMEFVGRPGWRRLLPHYTAEPCDAGTYYSRTIGH